MPPKKATPGKAKIKTKTTKSGSDNEWQDEGLLDLRNELSDTLGRRIDGQGEAFGLQLAEQKAAMEAQKATIDRLSATLDKLVDIV